MAFPFLGLFIIFLSVAAYYRKRATAQQKKVTEDFWSREDQANQIRRKDISNLPYITIPLEKFPIGISDDEELTDYENDLKTLASRKNSKSEPSEQYRLKACLWSCESSCFVRI